MGQTFITSLLILQGVTTLGALALAGYLSYLSAKREHVFAEEVRLSRESHTEMVNSALERVLIMKGLEPHHANPDKFLPGGMSYEAHEQAKAEFSATQGIDVGSDAEEFRREQEADLEEFRRTLGKPDMDIEKVMEHLRGRVKANG